MREDVKNEFVINGDLTTIILKTSKGKTFEAIIDTQDFPMVSRHKWFVKIPTEGRTSYVVSNISDGKKVRSVLLHRYLLNAPKGTAVDHIDNNGLNNSRKNLRLATSKLNSQNHVAAFRSNKHSRLRGVYWNKRRKVWHASMKYEGKQMHLGYFRELEDAHAMVAISRSIFMPFSKEAEMAVKVNELWTNSQKYPC